MCVGLDAEEGDNWELLVHAWSFLPGQCGSRELEGERILKCVFWGVRRGGGGCRGGDKGTPAMSDVAQRPGEMRLKLTTALVTQESLGPW